MAKKRSSTESFMTLGHIALAGWALVVIVPLLWTFASSFKTNSEIFGDAWTLPGALRWENWAYAWEHARIGKLMLNSVVVVAFSTFGTMLLGSMAAYVIARYKFPGNRFFYYFFISGLAFPVVLGLPSLFLIVRNLGQTPGIGDFLGLGTTPGLVLVYIAYSLPFTVFFLTAFFKTLPHSVAEAAMIDGASHTRLFFRVMMPMAKPGLISITIFNVIGQWNQYLLPRVLMQGRSGVEDKYVLTQGIAQISTTAGYEAHWGPLFAALTMSIIPMIVVYAFFQRQIQSGLTSGAVK
ncbi:carbohydrate ABC transporter permease [Longispora albida]|uniref:carbohydrate ABC transporter permease n=1 Tax=Longispora albida TaxID=203523 RepID=UPI000381AC7B|nr:carbohydrate ABC transporter permease [Longispora albida]